MNYAFGLQAANDGSGGAVILTDVNDGCVSPSSLLLEVQEKSRRTQTDRHTDQVYTVTLVVHARHGLLIHLLGGGNGFVEVGVKLTEGVRMAGTGLFVTSFEVL